MQGSDVKVGSLVIATGHCQHTLIEGRVYLVEDVLSPPEARDWLVGLRDENGYGVGARVYPDAIEPVTCVMVNHDRRLAAYAEGLLQPELDALTALRGTETAANALTYLDCQRNKVAQYLDWGDTTANAPAHRASFNDAGIARIREIEELLGTEGK